MYKPIHTLKRKKKITNRQVFHKNWKLYNCFFFFFLITTNQFVCCAILTFYFFKYQQPLQPLISNQHVFSFQAPKIWTDLLHFIKSSETGYQFLKSHLKIFLFIKSYFLLLYVNYFFVDICYNIINTVNMFRFF